MIEHILNKYINNEKGTDFSNYTPDGIYQLLEKLGNPHKELKTVHIAGTNGKGTICYIIARVLENSGYRTGLFISPHLLRLNERISINSVDISDENLLKYIKKADEAATDSKITATYFDILTAAAFCYFKETEIDIAVIETGLGGRLDSTNVINPEISVITDISMDHTQILGNSIEKITREKCGIIKKGKHVVTTNTNDEILCLINEYSEFFNAPLHVFSKSFHIEKLENTNGFLKFNYFFHDISPFLIELPLFPEHQIKNAAAATTVLLLLKASLFPKIDLPILLDTLKIIQIPGRFQKLCSSPVIYFDPAHNISSLGNLLNGVQKLYPTWKIILVITLMKDKATNEIMELLQDYKNNIIYYIIDDKCAYIPENITFSLISDNRKLIINRIKSETFNNTVILFTGTFRIYDFALEAAKLLDLSLNNNGYHGNY